MTQATTLRQKFIGDKTFYKMVLAVAVPIIIQNGITNMVNVLDNVMVGQLGTESMSGVAIANQLIFVFNLCIFGAVSGAGIFTAQFHGNLGECFFQRLAGIADHIHNGLYGLLQVGFGAIFFKNDPLPVPLVYIDRVDIIQILIPTDGVHIGI